MMIDRDALMAEIDRLQRRLDAYPSAQIRAALDQLVRLVNIYDKKHGTAST
jgi:hypothetical protein